MSNHIPIDGAGVSIAITTDYDGDTRKASPDIGFDEIMLFIVNAGNDTTICMGDSITLKATPGLGVPPYNTYAWSPATGLTTRTLTTRMNRRAS